MLAHHKTSCYSLFMAPQFSATKQETDMTEIYRVLAQWPGRDGHHWRQVKMWNTKTHVWSYLVQRYIGSGVWL